MIVFTATNKATKEVYVGSARDSMEEHWARLIVQAEEGGSGEFLEMVRESGADQIEVETWAYADSLAESRELVRDACEEFGAKLIKTGRAPAPKANSLGSVAPSPITQSDSDAPTDADEAIPSIHNHSQPSAEKSNVSPINARMSTIAAAAKAPTAKQNSTATKPSPATVKRETQKQHGPVTKIDVNAYLSAQKNKVEEKPQSEVIALRQTESTKVADDMKTVMMNIEMKRRQNRAGSASSTASKAKKTTRSASIATKKSNTTSINKASTAKKDKLPDGRVSSSAKEKRIKEAIAQERMERESAQAAKAAAEAKEMAEIMAKLDQRSKEKESLRRRR